MIPPDTDSTSSLAEGCRMFAGLVLAAGAGLIAIMVAMYLVGAGWMTAW